MVNVYKEFSFGLGDYLRGCLFLSQLCIHQKKIFLMNYSQHPICEFLTGGDMNEISDSIIQFPFEIKNRDDYFQRISFLKQFSQDKIYFEDNSFPLKPMNKNIVYSVLKQIQPTDILIQSIQCYLENLKLEKNNFIIIHLRIGDNTWIKQIIHNYFPFVFFKKSKIIHLGLSKQKDSEGVLDTLTEFFLMNHCREIISFSSYSHRTSFGEVASILFNKPFRYFSLLKKQMSITY